jgi:hypothetical protein
MFALLDFFLDGRSMTGDGQMFVIYQVDLLDMLA